MCLFGRNRPYRFEQLPAGEQQQYADVHRFMLGWYAKYEKYFRLEYPRNLLERQSRWDRYRARYLIECKRKLRLQEYVKELGVSMHNVMADIYPFPFDHAEVTIFYNTEQEVKMHEVSGVSEKMREQAMKLVEEVGYFDYFSKEMRFRGVLYQGVTISFSSWEFVQRYCNGSYKLWLMRH